MRYESFVLMNVTQDIEQSTESVFEWGGHWKNAVILLLLVFCARIQEGKHSQEIAEFQAELAEARTQLQLLQKQLDEQLSKEPIGNQEVTHWAAFPPQLTGLIEQDSA